MFLLEESISISVESMVEIVDKTLHLLSSAHVFHVFDAHLNFFLAQNLLTIRTNIDFPFIFLLDLLSLLLFISLLLCEVLLHNQFFLVANRRCLSIMTISLNKEIADIAV